MPRGPDMDLDVQRAIADYVTAGQTSGAAIGRELDRQERFTGRVPDTRAIQRLVKKLMPPDDSGPWSFADLDRGDGDPEEARLVLDVLPVIVEYTGGRVWPSRNLARWIVRVKRAAPTIPPWTAYVYARLYQVQPPDDPNTRLLDLLLALRPWDRPTQKPIAKLMMALDSQTEGGRRVWTLPFETGTDWDVLLGHEPPEYLRGWYPDVSAATEADAEHRKAKRERMQAGTA
jgi:hypothetical protein